MRMQIDQGSHILSYDYLTFDSESECFFISEERIASPLPR